MFSKKMSFECEHLFPLKLKKANFATKAFMLDGSNLAHSTNVLGRASTTLPRLALARYECDRSLLFSLWS